MPKLTFRSGSAISGVRITVDWLTGAVIQSPIGVP